MATIELDRAPLARSIPAAYAQAARTAGERPGWLTAAINLAAIVATFATVNFVTARLFERPSLPSEVVVAAETKADRTAIDRATESAAALAALASRARSVVPQPAGASLFGEPGAVVGQFAPAASYPPTAAFDRAPAESGASPPPAETPDHPGQPALLAYLPEAAYEPVERALPAPALDAIESLAAPGSPAATGEPLSLLPPLLESTGSGPTAVRQSLAATSGSAASAVRTTSESTRSAVGGTVTAVSTTTRSVTGSVRGLLN